MQLRELWLEDLFRIYVHSPEHLDRGPYRGVGLTYRETGFRNASDRDVALTIKEKISAALEAEGGRERLQYYLRFIAGVTGDANRKRALEQMVSSVLQRREFVGQSELEATAVRILKNPRLSEISFQIPGVPSVFGNQFFDVATAIENHDIITLTSDEVGDDGLKYVENQNGHNVLYLPRHGFASIRDNALLIHEAVHAMQDGNGIVAYQDDAEVAAYIAQCWFYEIHNWEPGTTGIANLAASRRTHYENVAIVLRNAQRIARGLRSTPPRTPSQVDVNFLRFAILQIPRIPTPRNPHPLNPYSHRLMNFDGIPHWTPQQQ